MTPFKHILPPGTDFMARLQEQLKYFVHNKISTDKMWQNVRVFLSGHQVSEHGTLLFLPLLSYWGFVTASVSSACTKYVSLTDPRGRRTQDHGVHSL